MVDSGPTLQQIEQQLRQALQGYGAAQDRNDLLAFVLEIHSALEQAAEHYLGDRQDLQRDEHGNLDLGWVDKVQTAFPDAANRTKLNWLNYQRAQIAHPKANQQRDVGEVHGVTVEFSNLATGLWYHLFQQGPPDIIVPPIPQPTSSEWIPPTWMPQPEAGQQVPWDTSTSSTLAKDDLLEEAPFTAPADQDSGLSAQPEQVPAQAEVAPSSFWRRPLNIAWMPLIVSFWLLLVAALITGLLGSVLDAEPIARLTTLLLTAGLVALVGAGLFFGWRALRKANLAALLVGALMLVAIATLFLVPLTPDGQALSQKAGLALSRVLEGMGAVVTGIPGAAYQLGYSLGGRVQDQNRPGTAPDQGSNPEPARIDENASNSMNEPTQQASQPGGPDQFLAADTMGPGSQVVTSTGGSELLVYLEPTASSPVTARFADGTPLTVVNGPRQAEGLTWFQVESPELAIGGWSADLFLRALEP